jgi:hypothetical protein
LISTFLIEARRIAPCRLLAEKCCNAKNRLPQRSPITYVVCAAPLRPRRILDVSSLNLAVPQGAAFFFVQGAQMCLAQARQCGCLQNPGRLRGKMAPILAGEGMAAKLSIK